MAQPASVTGQRLTPGRMTFTIADSAKAKASGEYGNYLTSQVAFTFGQSEKQEDEHGQESAEESPHIEAIVGQSYCAFAQKVVHTSANRIRPVPAAAAMW